MAVTPFRAKAEERAAKIKKDEDSSPEPSAKRPCNTHEKQLAKLPKGDLETDLLNYAASFRSSNNEGAHPAALMTELYGSAATDANVLHCQQLDGWYSEYATSIRNMPYLYKKPEQVAFDLLEVERSFKNISLSFRGSERQPPSSLQLALRFSKLIETKAREGEHPQDWTTEQRLQSIVQEFNESSGLQAKHRIEDERYKAVLNLLSGSCEEARIVIRHHLDSHKWHQSAFSTEQFKGTRWMLTAAPKAASCPSELRKCLTVTPASQVLHMKLVVKTFLDGTRRLRASARGKARLSSGQFDAMCDFACAYSYVWEEARLTSTWDAEKEAAMEKAFFQRDYSADIEAAVTAKMSTWKPQHLALWVDMVEPPKAPLSIPSAAELVEIEDQSQAARFREIRAKLSQDVADMTTFNSKNAEIERRGHVVSVMHEKAQMAVGKQLCETFMEKSCRISLVTKKDGFDLGLDNAVRAAAAAAKVDSKDVDTILYFDCTKLGVLSQAEVNLVGEYADKVLSKNPARQGLGSVLLLIPPLLCGSESVGSLRSDLRFCASHLWQRQSLPFAKFPKALDEKNFVVPGEGFLCHESRRSLSDLQETSQWMGGQAVPTALLEALTGDRKSYHAAVVVHPTTYDSCVELAAVKAGFIVLSSTGNNMAFNCSKEIMKTHLLEAWKNSRAPMNSVLPRYRKAPPPEEMPAVLQKPELRICQLSDGRLIIPRDIRQAFLTCPVWGPEWRDLLKAFDADWGVAVPSGPSTPSPSGPVSQSNEKKEEVKDEDGFWAKHFADSFKTLEALKAKFGSDLTEMAGPEQAVSFALVPGPALYIVGKEAVQLKESAGSPLVCHGAGTWLLGAKAEKYRADNPGRGIPCAWSSDEVLVVVEERGCCSLSLEVVNFLLSISCLHLFCCHDSMTMQEDQVDGPIQTLRQALQGFEKKGHVDYTLGGHQCSRPPGVQQGKAEDSFSIKPDPDNLLIWKPNMVAAKSLKAANVASSFTWPLLEASPLRLVTRPDCFFAARFTCFGTCSQLSFGLAWAYVSSAPLSWFCEVWRLRYWQNEKCVAAAKPLYFLPSDLTLEKGACQRII
ncbi:Uncharacterized protein SCF082_LOCUS7183 [Durusdinium trenchii]|uniref:Uncharacterized protein n=1 Tax=Durusdinium trenchii TaxID=1381693 RepID=A0ABP0IHI6_9DINO